MPNNQLITSYSGTHMDARESLDHKAYTHYAFIGSGNMVGAVFDVKEDGSLLKGDQRGVFSNPGDHTKLFSIGGYVISLV